MEILPSNRRNNLPAAQVNADGFNVLPAVQQDTKRQRSVTIMQNCGSAAKFFSFMIPANMDYIAEHRKDAVRKGKDFPLVALMIAYGQPVVEENIKIWVGAACLRLGMDWDNLEKSLIATTIANTEQARLLPYTYIVGFFKWLCEGHAPLYAGKLANVMEAFQCYARRASAEVRQLHEEMERQQREQEWQQHSQECVKFDVEAWIKEHFGK